MIIDSSQDGLSAVAGRACRVPESGAVEAEFAGADGTLVQRRWVEPPWPSGSSSSSR
ncbi:hypothetical protein ACFQ10_00060 [Streptomyces indonesiensis]